MNRSFFLLVVVTCSCSNPDATSTDLGGGTNNPGDVGHDTNPNSRCDELAREFDAIQATQQDCASDDDCVIGSGCFGEPRAFGTPTGTERLPDITNEATELECNWYVGYSECGFNSDTTPVQFEGYARAVCEDNRCEVSRNVACEDVGLFANGRYPVSGLAASFDRECEASADCVLQTDTNPCGCNDAVPASLPDVSEPLAAVVEAMRACGGFEQLCACPTTDEVVCNSEYECELASPFPNEPAGLPITVDQPFNTLRLGEWLGGGDHASIQSDATAPLSPSNVMQVQLPVGTVAGERPGTGGIEVPHDVQFVGLHMKCSDPWESSTRGEPFLRLQAGSDAIALGLVQNVDTSTLELRFGDVGNWEDGGAEFSCGEWHQVEVLTQDGITVWLDGTLVFTSPQLSQVNATILEPMWGDSATPKTLDSSLSFDHIRITGWSTF